MPQILVTADPAGDLGEGVVLLRERVTVADLESGHFATQLIERLGWAVGDASEAERAADLQRRRRAADATLRAADAARQAAEPMSDGPEPTPSNSVSETELMTPRLRRVAP
jgi:hypothetical protein